MTDGGGVQESRARIQQAVEVECPAHRIEHRGERANFEQMRPRGEGFYAGYFRDLDGNKLNVFFMG